jgi:heme oxygenase
MQEQLVPFSKQLKEASWPVHQKTDKLVFGLLKNSTSVLTTSLANWYSTLKRIKLLESQEVRSLIDFDLEHLRSLLPASQEVNKAHEGSFSDHQRLGMYYVIRGSANGSRFIVKNLAQQHLLKPYFDFLASLDLQSWEETKARLDQVEKSKQHEVIEGATLAFQWLLEEITALSDLTEKPTDINQQ